MQSSVNDSSSAKGDKYIIVLQFSAGSLRLEEQMTKLELEQFINEVNENGYRFETNGAITIYPAVSLEKFVIRKLPKGLSQ